MVMTTASVVTDWISALAVAVRLVPQIILLLYLKPFLQKQRSFREVIVTWDTTPEAMDEWRQSRSACYDDVANASLHGLVPGTTLLDRVSSLLSEAGLPENETPSRNLRVGVRVEKRRSGIGPYPKLVRTLGELVREWEDRDDSPGKRGLRAWVALRMSVSHAWKVRAVRRRVRRLYRESERRRTGKS